MNCRISQILFNSISEAVKDDYQSILGSQNLITHNSKYTARWDFINTNVFYRLLKENDVEIRVAHMGNWDFLIILDKESQTLYSLMNSKRFETIVGNPAENAPLYLKSFVTLNEDLECVSPCLPGMSEYMYANRDLFAFILRKLCQDLDTENVHYNLVTFSTDSQDNIIELKLHILDKNLQQLDSVDLLNNIMPVYSSDVEQAAEEDFERPVLKLKQKAEARLGMRENVEIRNDSSEILKNA